LDDSKARVRMLVAPAGYGKTTLAEQWVARDGRQAIWYTARSSSTDVAALALGIAKRATAIVEDCDVRLRTHMRAVSAAAENVQTLAEILGEDLAAWPSNAWLVIDDYHEVAQEPHAEAFVHALVSASPVQFLIASRVRPSWVTTKDRLYGDALEVSQTALAMDTREAADVLVERSEDSASGLVALANGWPAVIGLASVSSAEIEDGVEAVPESLYRFFADEVFGALGAEVRQGLTTLAVAPVIDGELATAMLGEACAETVTAAALDVGLLVERNARLDLHPLARSFLEEKSGQLGLRPSDDAAETCLAIYRARREWDAAFDLISRSCLTGHLEGLMASAIDELLEGARLSTLERWCDLASEADVDAPIFALARAETMLRDGRHIEAIAHAERAAAGEKEIEFRALAIAGRAAHLASREEHALSLYERAEAAASSETELRDAKWGQLVCMIDLELPTANSVFAELSEAADFGDPRELVRAAGHRLYLQLRQGSLSLDEAEMVSQLLPTVSDPLVRSSFLSAYATALALTARYHDALDAADELGQIVEQYRLDFAQPYVLAVTAMARSGLREWRDAEAAAMSGIKTAQCRRDTHGDLLNRAVLLRSYAQQGRHSVALELGTGKTTGAIDSSVAEVVLSRALVLGCAGRTAEARELCDDMRGTTNAIEPLVLGRAVDAVCSLREASADVVDRTLDLERVAFRSGAADLLVTAYRACPELLVILLRAAKGRRFRELVERVGDVDLASAAGYPIAVNDDKRVLLTPRETDVYELLRTGLSNREIGKLLYIEESTVKAHTHRIYDKLGVRSRSALAVQAALERASQATSATDSSPEAESS
jgi:ATP/maltotriose-dependent transcriptional regulator MalT